MYSEPCEEILGITGKRKFLAGVTSEIVVEKNCPALPQPLANPSTGYTEVHVGHCKLNRRRTIAIAKVLDIGKFCKLITI